MTYTEALLRFVAGGSLILTVSLLGKSKFAYLASIAVLFPAVTVAGYYFLSFDVSTVQLKSIIFNSLYYVPTTMVFLYALYRFVGSMPMYKSLIIALGFWLIAALGTTALGNYFDIWKR
ncbi:GlpM family protein [Heliorestis acidaminivorans]|uniref:GlpM family protein n=1 Tax=Heliorestis acidaminivorans TaxID=553427 RepID=UPI001478738F|nr:GlpM family protein [Heliorestis acidaminivorans]